MSGRLRATPRRLLPTPPPPEPTLTFRDPRFIREFKAKYCVEAMVEHVTQKKRRKLWRKKDQKFEYPYKEIGPVTK